MKQNLCSCVNLALLVGAWPNSLSPGRGTRSYCRSGIAGSSGRGGWSSRLGGGGGPIRGVARDPPSGHRHRYCFLSVADVELPSASERLRTKSRLTERRMISDGRL